MAVPNGDKEGGLAALAQPRQQAYAFLSTAFARPPSVDTIQMIRGPAFLASASQMFGEETLAPLREFARATEEVSELQHRGHQEFMDLFKVPGPKYVIPYESVFRDTREMAGEKVKGCLQLSIR